MVQFLHLTRILNILLIYLTQQATAGDQVVYRMAIQNNVMSVGNFKIHSKYLTTDLLLKAAKKADESRSTITADRRQFIVSTKSRIKSR